MARWESLELRSRVVDFFVFEILYFYVRACVIAVEFLVLFMVYIAFKYELMRTLGRFLWETFFFEVTSRAFFAFKLVNAP